MPDSIHLHIENDLRILFEQMIERAQEGELDGPPGNEWMNYYESPESLTLEMLPKAMEIIKKHRGSN